MRPSTLCATLSLVLLSFALAGCMGIQYSDQPTATVDLTQAGAPAEAGTRVLAQAAEWRNSGIVVLRGQRYVITAQGRWSAGGICGWTGPDGSGISPFCANGSPVRGWTGSALVAKVGEGGVPFGVGASYVLQPLQDGILYFKINDPPGLSGDNQGHMDVGVRALAPGAAIPALALTPPQPSPQASLARKKAAASAAAEQAKLQARQQAEQQAMLEALAQQQAQQQPVYQPGPAYPPPSAPPAVGPSRRVALVIGNGAYPGAMLKNPVNDARDMAAALRGLGFEVILRENASLRQMEEAVDLLWSKLRGGGAGLFFFAGHGLQVGGRNYLVPVDARLSAEQDVKYRAMDAGLVLGRMENAGNGLNIVILDACRNNPYARSWRGVNEGLAKMDAPKGSIIAYATAPDSVAADGTGRNGIYTGELLRHLRTPGLGIEEMFKRVRIGVLRDTGDRQVPWESSSLTGWFSFSQ